MFSKSCLFWSYVLRRRRLERFRLALDLNPEMLEAHAGLASIHYNQNRYDEALAAVERALALNPGHATALRLRFLIHDETGNREAADEAIEAYAAVEPGPAVELLFRRAEFDFRAERYQPAEATLLKMLVIVLLQLFSPM